MDGLSHPIAPPLAVRPLDYFDVPDEGWEAATRLTLIFTAIYAGARTCSGCVYEMMLLGSAGSSFSSLAAIVWTCSQVVFPIAVLVVSLVGITARSRGARITLVVCLIVWIATGLLAAALSAMQMSQTSLGRSGPPTLRAAYVLNPLVGALSSAVMPTFLITLLTRPGVRRRFGEVGIG